MSVRRRLRIAMTTDAVGGVWTYATALAGALAAQGHRVLLIVTGPAPQAHALRSMDGLHGVAVEPTDFALEWMDPEGSDIARAHDGLRRIARRFRPDIAHVNGFRDAAADWGCPVLLVAHSCVRSWWRACRGADPDEERWWRYIENARLGLAAADCWVAPTVAFARTIAELYEPSRPGEVIWNGGGEHGLPQAKEDFVLAAGRLWDEAKNVDLLAAVAGEIAWPVALAGAARCAPAVGGEPHAARCLGELPRDELLGVMRRAAIYAAPARYEPFGLAVLEAADAGCALVLSDIASFRELWDGAAVFVDHDDRRALRDALRGLIADPVRRAALQRAARRRARRYSLVRMVRSYTAVCRRLTRQQHAPVGALPALAQAAP